MHGRNIAADFAVIERASPFIHRLRRCAVSIVLEGIGRFEEGGRRAWLGPGDLAFSDERRMGTEAYAGEECRTLIVEWEPAVLGSPITRPFFVERLSKSDLARVCDLWRTCEGPQHDDAVVELIAILRAHGVPLSQVTAGDLAKDFDPRLQQLATAMTNALSRLEHHPAIEDVVDELGWGARLVNRKIDAYAERYALPYPHWRSALHYTRMMHAVRLLAAPRATTEIVARLTGFRAPAALCHAFAKAGLPSPGVLAKAARSDVLDAWIPFGETPPGAPDRAA
jgi:hypothetical protein